MATSMPCRCSSSRCIAASNRRTVWTGSRLASNIAMSARRSRCSGSGLSAPGAPASAIPTLAPRYHSTPADRNGSFSAATSRPASASASASSTRSAATTTNSSPPRRWATSSGRIWSRSRWAASTSTSSPNACPAVSFTCLKRSRSTNSSPTGPERRASRSSSSYRLGSPVSGSCRARKSSSRWASSETRRASRSSRSASATRTPTSTASTTVVPTRICALTSTPSALEIDAVSAGATIAPTRSAMEMPSRVMCSSVGSATTGPSLASAASPRHAYDTT